MPTTTKDFIALVDTMRRAQRAYFKYRTQDDLDVARRLERKVDDALGLLTGRKSLPLMPEAPNA
jgi:hypothetical protein